MLCEDEEFRLAVMGLLGFSDLKSSVDRLVEAVNELTKLAKAHEERLAGVEGNRGIERAGQEGVREYMEYREAWQLLRYVSIAVALKRKEISSQSSSSG